MVVTNRGERGADHPLLLPLLALIAGIHAAVSAGTHLRYAPFVILLTLLPFSLPRRPLLILVVTAAAAGYGYVLAAGRVTPPNGVWRLLREGGREAVPLVGSVIDHPRVGERGVRFPLLLSRPGYGGIVVMMTLPADWRGEIPNVGDRIRALSRLYEIRSRGLPGESDPRQGDHLRGRFLGGIPRPGSIEIIGTDGRYRLARWLARVRERLCGEIDQRMPHRCAAVARAIILGEKSRLTAQDQRRFAKAGVNHILAVSGLHVGVVVTTLLLLIRLVGRFVTPILLRFDLRKLSLILSLPPVWGYLLLTGSAPATVRAVMMFSVLVLIFLREQECHILDILILAALVMLAVEPALLYQVSFQLSFTALGGIVILSPPLIRLTTLPSTSPWYPLVSLVLVSLSAIIATAPLAAWHFGTLSLSGAVSNILLIPLLGYLVVIGGFAGLVTLQIFPPAGDLILSGVTAVISLSLRLVDLFARIPVLDHLNPSPLFILLSFAGFLVAAFYRHDRIVGPLFAGVTLSVATAGVVSASQRDHSLLRVTFLSLGQAESTLIQRPTGETILVDTGGRLFGDNAGFSDRYLLPALRRLGVKRIDTLILSHPHPDHVGGVGELLQRIPVGEIGGSPETLSMLSPPVTTTRLLPLDGRSSPLSIGGVTVEPFWPLPVGEGGDMNDRSLVIRIGWGEGGVLLTGDIGWEVADHLAATAGKRLPSTILKLPHHGSRHSNSPRFVDRVSPSLAVVFAGWENRFGLPSPETVAEIHARRIPLWRTDLDGTLTLLLDREGKIASACRQSN